MRLLGAGDEQRGRDMVTQIYWDIVSNARIGPSPSFANLATAVIDAAGALYGPQAKTAASAAWANVGLTPEHLASFDDPGARGPH